MRLLLLALVLLAAAVVPAAAHPHVWVTSKSEFIYDAEGRFTGVRQIWSFDDVFSSFATQGLDKNGDGKLSRDELQPLARTNVTSLKDFGYFTVGRLGDELLTFLDPTDYWLEEIDNRLVLHFFLPLDKPRLQEGKRLAIDIYDPTYYVDFELADTDPATLVGADKSCSVKLVRPDKPDATQKANALNLDNSFLSTLGQPQTFGMSFQNHIYVTCP